MALHIRNAEVDRLVEQVKSAYGVKTKTEAVRLALQKALDAHDQTLLRKKLAATQSYEPHPHSEH